MIAVIAELRFANGCNDLKHHSDSSYSVETRLDIMEIPWENVDRFLDVQFLFRWQFKGTEEEAVKSIPYQLQRLFVHLQVDLYLEVLHRVIVLVQWKLYIKSTLRISETGRIIWDH